MVEEAKPKAKRLESSEMSAADTDDPAFATVYKHAEGRESDDKICLGKKFNRHEIITESVHFIHTFSWILLELSLSQPCQSLSFQEAASYKCKK
jgi:hypothetical protein